MSAFARAGWVKGISTHAEFRRARALAAGLRISALALGMRAGDGMHVAWRVFIFLLGIAGAGGGLVQAEALPLRGEISGALKITALAELGLKWELVATDTGVVLSAKRPGVVLQVAATPLQGGACTWKVVQGDVDLAELWPVLRSAAGSAAASWSASGRLGIAGEGGWSSEGGLTGEVRVALREGWAKSDELQVEVTGIELDASTRDLTGGTMPATQQLRVARITKAGANVEHVEVQFGLNTGLELEVKRLLATFLGGQVKLKPFKFSLTAPKVQAGAEVEGLLLTEAARLMPWAVANAEGRLKGRVVLAWDETKGLRVLDGGMDIVRSDAATFRLAPSEGFLTGNMPKRFKVSEKAWASWISFSNPAYKPLQKIEMGESGVVVEALRVTFWPDGEGIGRTATVHIEGRPTDEKLVEKLVIDLNFHGPWSEVMAFGLNQEASFGFKVD